MCVKSTRKGASDHRYLVAIHTNRCTGEFRGQDADDGEFWMFSSSLALSGTTLHNGYQGDWLGQRVMWLRSRGWWRPPSNRSKLLVQNESPRVRSCLWEAHHKLKGPTHVHKFNFEFYLKLIICGFSTLYCCLCKNSWLDDISEENKIESVSTRRHKLIIISSSHVLSHQVSCYMLTTMFNRGWEIR